MKSRLNGHGVAASRGEWEWPIGQDSPEVARLAQTPQLAAAAVAIKGRLQPAFVTDIRRTTHLLRLDNGTTAEVAFDEGDIQACLAREAASELEIELKSGGVEPIYRLAGSLLSTAPLWLMSESKASRGWRLRTGQGAGAQPTRPLKFKRRLCADAGFRQIFGATLGHLTANIGPTLRGDPEGLHQARVAIREARAVLQLFDGYLDADGASRFKETLRTYGEILGEARTGTSSVSKPSQPRWPTCQANVWKTSIPPLRWNANSRTRPSRSPCGAVGFPRWFWGWSAGATSAPLRRLGMMQV